MKTLILLFIFTSFTLSADIKSTSGEIKFDVQSDQQAELTLNSTGLGIGTSPSGNLHVNGNSILSKQVYIGEATGSSNLNVNGLLGFGIQTATSDTTLGTHTLILADSTSDNVTLTLPSASSSAGQTYRIKRIVDNEHYVHLVSSDNIDGDSDYYDLTGYQTVMMVSNGTQWYNMTPSSTAEVIPASDNLVAWWKFNNDSATYALDSSGSHHHGSFVDNASVANSVLVTDGTTDEVLITGYKGITGENSRSVSMWMNGDQTPLDKALISWGTDSSGQKFIMRAQEANGTPSTLRVEVNGGYAVGSSNILDSNWHHVVMTLENDGSPNVNEVKLYVDGTEETLSASSSQSINTDSGEDVKIANDHSNREFDGTIDDVRIYDRALTDAEILIIYNQGR